MNVNENRTACAWETASGARALTRYMAEVNHGALTRRRATLLDRLAHTLCDAVLAASLVGAGFLLLTTVVSICKVLQQ